MKKLKLKTLGIFAIALLSLSLFSCDNADNQNQSQETSRLMVKMTDAPGDYDQVNVEVLDVMIKGSTDSGDNGWISVGNKAKVGTGKIYDLLKLTGGVNIMLTDSLIPVGNLGQLRLVLGTKNTVVVDGTSFDLSTPSAEQSGLKLQVNQSLTSGTTYEFLLDFDVDKSIVTTGNSKYILKPVIRVATSVASGVIKGIVSPAVDYQVLASVQQGDKTFSAYVTKDDKDGDTTDGDGAFQINGIPAGTYTLTLTPDPTSGKAPVTVANVIVTNGKTTDVGNVTIP